MNEHIGYQKDFISNSEDLEWYKKDITGPSNDDIKSYSEQTERAINDLKNGFKINVEGIRFVYGNWSKERAEELIENRETSYTSGYSFHPDFHHWEEVPTVYLKSSKIYDGWEDGFRNSVVHEIAHQLFYSGDFSGFEDQIDSIVFEGHAMTLARQICDMFGYDYASQWRPDETIDVEYERIIQELPKQRKLSDEDGENIGNLFRGGEPFSNQEGYMISYQTGDWIVNNTEYEIQGFPNFSRREREKIVRRALKSLYA